MTIAIVVALLAANLVAGVANLIGILRVIRAVRVYQAPRPVDANTPNIPSAGGDGFLERSIVVAEQQLQQRLTAPPPRVHYVVRRTLGHDEIVLYDGYDSDLAYAAWMKMERDPANHPGYHEYSEDGRPRAFRHHSEIAS